MILVVLEIMILIFDQAINPNRTTQTKSYALWWSRHFPKSSTLAQDIFVAVVCCFLVEAFFPDLFYRCTDFASFDQIKHACVILFIVSSTINNRKILPPNVQTCFSNFEKKNHFPREPIIPPSRNMSPFRNKLIFSLSEFFVDGVGFTTTLITTCSHPLPKKRAQFSCPTPWHSGALTFMANKIHDFISAPRLSTV